ncbi:MAG: DUF4911 domain-containing protein [Deltaproteobacteria bacterium]|nr:DUF4911 domain-containing protein [Deltaproteobacteria bacterium]
MSNKIIKKVLKLKRKDIAYIKFIFEGYEGLGIVTTIDSGKSLIEISMMPDFVSDINEILDALREEIIFQEVDITNIERNHHEQQIS